jgi:Zn-dependent M28 family amino/carboxypeptidase
MKFLADNDIRFENTEVAVLCAGGEEAGLRGSKAFAKANKDMLNDGVETVFVSFDTIRELEFAKIYEKDMTGMVKNDRRVAELIQSACKEVGYDNVHIGTIALGSTDAAAMSQAKIPASSIVAMDPTPARYYHTRLDDADNLSAQAIDFGVKVALETVFLYDEKGI